MPLMLPTRSVTMLMVSGPRRSLILKDGCPSKRWPDSTSGELFGPGCCSMYMSPRIPFATSWNWSPARTIWPGRNISVTITVFSSSAGSSFVTDRHLDSRFSDPRAGVQVPHAGEVHAHLDASGELEVKISR